MKHSRLFGVVQRCCKVTLSFFLKQQVCVPPAHTSVSAGAEPWARPQGSNQVATAQHRADGKLGCRTATYKVTWGPFWSQQSRDRRDCWPQWENPPWSCKTYTFCPQQLGVGLKAVLHSFIF